MITYSLIDFFIQSVLMVLVGLLFWGLALALIVFIAYTIYEHRERKKQNRLKIVYPQQWHKPADMEDA